MSTPIYFASMFMLFGTPIVIFGMKYCAAMVQAWAHARNDGIYHALADKAATAQDENNALLLAMKSDLAALKSQMAAVEKILKAVE